MSERIALTRVCALLFDLTKAPPPSYQRVWNAAVSGRFPVLMIDGRYWVNRSDLPLIAKVFGMPLPGAPVPLPTRGRPFPPTRPAA
jgi:hypothetical protein